MISNVYRCCKGYNRIANGHWLRPVVSSNDPIVNQAEAPRRLNPSRAPGNSNSTLIVAPNQCTISHVELVSNHDNLEGPQHAVGGERLLDPLVVD